MARHCTLMFDEMALEPRLHYDKHKDCVFGLEDYGHLRQPSFADHVLTFMIQGLKKKFKQPICFYFVKSTVKTLELKKCIEEVVRILHNLNFKYRKCNDGRRFLMERNNIVACQVKFLRKMYELRQNNDTRPVVYLDETWVNQNHTQGYIWQN